MLHLSYIFVSPKKINDAHSACKLKLTIILDEINNLAKQITQIEYK